MLQNLLIKHTHRKLQKCATTELLHVLTYTAKYSKILFSAQCQQ